MTVQVVDRRTNSLSCCYLGICIVNKEKIPVKLLLMASFDFFWCCWYRLKTYWKQVQTPRWLFHKHNKLSHYDKRFSISTCNWVEHRLVGFLQSPDRRSLYEIYENHKGNKREKRNSEEKNYRSLSAPFFQQIKTYFETLLRKSLSSSD